MVKKREVRYQVDKYGVVHSVEYVNYISADKSISVQA